jgi:hypothetical protein
MPDFRTSKRAAVRYWEWRRVIYNFASLLAAFLSYSIIDELNWVGDPHETHYSFILPQFVFSAIGADICYTLCYTLEFLVGSDDPASRWLRFGRSYTFGLGLLLAMFLAMCGGAAIADAAYYHGIGLMGGIP